MNTIELWTALHEHPELSGQECTTIGILQDYLRQESDLELHDEPGWFWGIHRESKAAEDRSGAG
jgi:metal-dependent amidase/aminoacylase/carboxypeptidase family protein